MRKFFQKIVWVFSSLIFVVLPKLGFTDPVTKNAIPSASDSNAAIVEQSLLQAKKSRDNFMVVLRETQGTNKPEDAFVPQGRGIATFPDGTKASVEIAAWEYIGDTHVRFVFDGPKAMLNANTEDLSALGITNIHEALDLAIKNIRRVYGEPIAEEFTQGLMEVHGKSPDLDSSYFLDRAFWNKLLENHPEGLVVAVPKRGGLLYTPVSNAAAVDALKRGVVNLFLTSERLRVSSALYLFKNGRWSVFQAPSSAE